MKVKMLGYHDSHTQIKALGRNSTMKPFGVVKMPRRENLEATPCKNTKKKLEESMIPKCLSSLFR